jgi:hypothetical protein
MLYKPLVDAWMLYDNAGEAPVVVASMTVDATPPPLALAALAALRRARLRAIEVARATNTCLVVYRDGKIVRIPPHELPTE